MASLLFLASGLAGSRPARFTSVAAGDVARVKALSERRPHARQKRTDENDQFASLPLHLAAITGNLEIARLLLEAGADVDCGTQMRARRWNVAANEPPRRYGDF